MELVVEMTYGSALFDAARELEKLEEIKGEIIQIDQILKGEPSFIELLRNPAIPKEKKKQMVREVFDGSVCREVMALLFILIDKDRIAHFHGIVKAYLRLYDRHYGEACGTIFSAVELTPEELEKFEKQTGTLLQETIKLKNVVDPSVLGGVKIAVDGKLIDASLSSRLKDLQTEIHKF